MPKESYTPTPDEQSKIDEGLGHANSTLRMNSEETERQYNRMTEEQRNALNTSDITQDKMEIITGTISGHKVFISPLQGDQSTIDGKPISPEEAIRLFKKYWPVAAFQDFRKKSNINSNDSGDTIAGTL